LFTGGLEARKLEIFGKKGGREAGVDWARMAGEGERGAKVECKSLVDGWLESDFNHRGRSPPGKEAPGVPWGEEQVL
jgi:hypothetical protein